MAGQMKTLSFIVPIYNQEKYVEEYLDSLCSMKLENYEIICVDDGSKDRTGELLDAYAARDGKVRVYHIENRGPGYARNFGIDKAEGKYVAFCDADDKIDADVYEKMYRKIVDENLELVVAHYEEVFDSGVRNRKNYEFQSEEDYFALVRGWIAVFAKIYQREFLQKNQITFPESYQGEDRVFLSKLAVAKPKMAWMEDIAYYYMRHESEENSTLTHSYDFKYFEQRVNNWKEFYKICSATYKEQTIKAVYKGMIYIYPFWRRLELEEKTKGLKLLQELLGLIEDLDKQQRVFGITVKDFMEVNSFDDYAHKRVPNRVASKVADKAKKEKPEISIIMPIYNAGKYLAQCLHSIITQSYDDFEVICVDDGSDDDTIEIIQEFMAVDKRISLIKQSHQMAGVARNNGMKVAKGRFYLFLDGDDFFEEKMLENTYKRIEEDAADVCIFGARTYYETSGKYKDAPWLLKEEYIPEQIPFEGKKFPYVFNMTNANPWNKLIRRELVEEHGLQFMPLQRCNDVYFIFMTMALARKITIDNNVYVNYRQAPTTLQANNDRSPLDWYSALTELKKGLCEKGIYKDVEQSFMNCVLSISMYNLFSLKKGTNFVSIYNQLRNGKLQELGLLEHGAEYFYPHNEDAYERLQTVLEYDPCDYIYDELRRANGAKEYWMKKSEEEPVRKNLKYFVKGALWKVKNLYRYSLENGKKAALRVVVKKILRR